MAEEIVFGEDEVTTGAANYLKQVAQVARQMVTRFGMSEKLGPVALGRSQGGMFLGRDIASERDFSEDTAATIDSEVSELVDSAYKRPTKPFSDRAQRYIPCRTVHARAVSFVNKIQLGGRHAMH